MFDDAGGLVWSAERVAPRAASTACAELLQAAISEGTVRLKEVTLFLADLGPGSFTGVRVGVMMAKTLAYAHNALAGGADAFDLIDPASVVAFPSRKGEFFVRVPGQAVTRGSEAPEGAVGFGFGEPEVFPHARRFGAILLGIERVDPMKLEPKYLMEPSISLPKKPLSRVGERP